MVAVLLMLCGCGNSDEPPPTNTLSEYLPIAAGYNVVIMSFDALRADALGVYGYNRPTSPNIDAFAKQALVFDNAVTAGKDTPTSFVSAFTGEFPFRVFRGWELQHVPTLAASFNDAGYVTAAFMHNVQLVSERGFAQGFDHFDTLHSSRVSDGTVIDEVTTWVEDRSEEPFLLWVHFISPHAPYEYREFATDLYVSGYEGPFKKSSGTKISPQEVDNAADRRRLRDLYDGEVLYADRLFGRMIRVLKRHGAWNNSIIVLTADHGEAFGEHGEYGHDTLYTEVLQVPLIIRHPGAQKAGRTDMLYSNIDLYPTLATMLKVPHPDYMDGVSMVSSPWEKRPLLSVAMTSEDYRALAVRAGNDKLIVECVSEEGLRPVALFDLGADPREENNVLAQRPATVELLLGHLHDLAGEQPCETLLRATQGKSIETDMSDERLEQLRSLGYIQ